MINTEDSFGLCAYQEGNMCGAILGCMEQFYHKIMFNIKRPLLAVFLAESQGFEPWVSFPTQHFECCTFDHSDNSP